MTQQANAIIADLELELRAAVADLHAAEEGNARLTTELGELRERDKKSVIVIESIDAYRRQHIAERDLARADAIELWRTLDNATTDADDDPCR